VVALVQNGGESKSAPAEVGAIAGGKFVRHESIRDLEAMAPAEIDEPGEPGGGSRDYFEDSEEYRVRGSCSCVYDSSKVRSTKRKIPKGKGEMNG
jgi:hypothetical protein